MTDVATTAGLRLRELLIDLEYLLRDGGLWCEDRPSDWAFASEMPFAHDRMSFPNWLQFVFMPTLERLVADAEPWPADCAVAPMVEIYFSDGSATRLYATLERIDRLVSAYDSGEEELVVTQRESDDLPPRG